MALTGKVDVVHRPDPRPGMLSLSLLGVRWVVKGRNVMMVGSITFKHHIIGWLIDLNTQQRLILRIHTAAALTFVRYLFLRSVISPPSRGHRSTTADLRYMWKRVDDNDIELRCRVCLIHFALRPFRSTGETRSIVGPYLVK